MKAIRLALGIILPVLVANCYFILEAVLFSSSEYFPSLPDILGLLGLGYILFGIQSIIYSLLMEFIINPKIKASWLAVVLSGALGALSAIPLTIYFIPMGILSGIIVGTLLRIIYVKHPH